MEVIADIIEKKNFSEELSFLRECGNSRGDFKWCVFLISVNIE